jgi:hypothetical protein
MPLSPVSEIDRAGDDSPEESLKGLGLQHPQRPYLPRSACGAPPAPLDATGSPDFRIS